MGLLLEHLRHPLEGETHRPECDAGTSAVPAITQLIRELGAREAPGKQPHVIRWGLAWASRSCAP
ncbi:hypothetical protein GCM10028802_20810 [Terrabacter terrigena]